MTDAMFKRLVALRRKIHQYPETAFMKRFKPYGWTRRTLWLGFLRVFMGRYPKGSWM